MKMSMRTKQYGLASTRGDVLTLPPALIRDCGIRGGDVVAVQRRRLGGVYVRFYRRDGDRWLRLLLGRTRVVKYPR